MKDRNKGYILAFFMPIFFMLLAYALNGTYPFGGKSVLTADLYSQYIDVTVATVEQLKAGGSLFITWKSGLGSNLYAIVLYVLCSPLNLLFFLFKSEYYQEVYFALLLIKFGLIGLFANIYFEKSKLININNAFKILFSTIYAVGIFSIKATINPMWMENIALLPLVFLGVEKIIDDRKMGLYFISILMCFVTNYYLSYITGIFTALYFIYYYVVSNNSNNILNAVVRFFGATFLALGVAAIVLIPAWKGISGTYTDVFGVGNNGELIRYNLKNVLFIFLYIIQERATSGIANCYIGILPILLLLAYFANTLVAKKEKIISILYIALFGISLVLNPLYMVWHLFRAPTGFDARFLYGVVLFILIIAMRGFEKISGVSKKAFTFSLLLIFVSLNYALFGRVSSFYAMNAIVTILLSIIYCLLLIKGSKKSIGIILLLAFVECFSTGYFGIKVIGDFDEYADREEYIQYQTEYRNEFDKLASLDDGFYRVDSTKTRSYNSSMSMGYNGVLHFSSLANQRCFSVLKSLGSTALTDNKVLLNYGQNVVLDSLLGTKYTMVVDKNDIDQDSIGRNLFVDGFKLSSDFYEKYYEDDSSIIYENKAVFPIMFKANAEIKDLDLKSEQKYIDIFGNQSKFLSALSGEKEELYTKYVFDTINAENALVNVDENGLMNIELNKLDENEYMATDVEKVARISLQYEVKNSGNYYACAKGVFPFNAIVGKIAWIMVNNIPMRIYYMDNELLDFGYLKKGDVVTLDFYCAIDTDIYLPNIYKLNDDVLKKTSTIVKQNALKDIKEKDGTLYATSDFDEKSLVFASIGYDDGFTVRVDGNEVEKIRLADGFLGFEVPGGEHDIDISYTSVGFTNGRNISIIFLCLTAIVFIVDKRRKSSAEQREQL